MDFIGTKFNTPKGGILTVVGKLPREPGKNAKYQLECSICSKDTELFPELFTSGKSSLTRGSCPCGCSTSHKWTKEQYKIIIIRKIKDKCKFLGFVGEFKGTKTKVKLCCLIDGYEWDPSINDLLHGGHGCPCCGGNARYTKETATDKIMKVIKDKYEFRGFVGEFKNIHTHVKLYCPSCVHGWEPTFNKVVHGRRGCPCCAPYGYRPNYPSKLYIIKYTTKSNQTFLKYGITKQDINQRSKQHVKKSGTTGEILHVCEFEDGTIPLQIENEIHDLRDEVGYIETSKEEFPDGYTETLDVRYEKDVLAIIQKYVQYVPEYEERLCA